MTLEYFVISLCLAFIKNIGISNNVCGPRVRVDFRHFEQDFV